MRTPRLLTSALILAAVAVGATACDKTINEVRRPSPAAERPIYAAELPAR